MNYNFNISEIQQASTYKDITYVQHYKQMHNFKNSQMTWKWNLKIGSVPTRIILFHNLKTEFV